ncbi:MULTISPECIES: hypothetical protein [Flavobacterium]|jgi:hypothetical protein|uniref:Uncharacterized protein n=2 Tax=Flavobacterium TaxID=237 RepID=A0A1S1J3H9_9FLAO|nr:MULTISPECIES: hypothetical protein [Flavobacterium]KFF09848.1 hypothetical protein IW20_22330 [Flavobacterium hydatis]MDL2142772.1 hypothetical protein [Flavobacterium tructae]OHT43726.1 hypothetical protein BHE19_15335 [Flavobacterium tructae]OXB20495.1 hypothetical protein B0A71_06720 [Flavobacterium tructae]UWY27635.1 hypothetical protein N4T20_18120 [Flavobacterium sp. TR2]
MESSNEKFEQDWIEYRNAVSDNKSKSQDDFEKYINLLASGGIVLSLTFLEKIITVDKTDFKPLYIIGLICLVLTLLSNLYSHYKSIIDSDLTIQEIDEKKYNDIFKNIKKRNKIINRLNRTSIWSLIIGVVFVLTFVTINLFNMSNKQNPSPPAKPMPATEEKGRTIPLPPQNRPANNPKK